ncbi:transcription factor MafK-like [Actinia tenebrosa]|uniref:Neural retina-specific leucine zipper protein n=1 Tax=Actinia tenebrosa TaxID=6105 RepID=A0A6P8HTQ0_ACTTE|nr:transcription factor MafK-like [Actinia tenebrosa]
MDLGDMEKFFELQSPLTPKENEQLNGFPLDDAWFSKTATYDIFEEMEETQKEFICGAFETTSTISTAPNSPAVNDYDTFEITDEELRNLPVKQLNQKLRDLPKIEASKLRKRRRSLKNRGYALNCRNKRVTENEQLQKTNIKLRIEVAKIKEELSKAVRERDIFKQKYERINSVFSTICTTSAMTLKGASVSKS